MDECWFATGNASDFLDNGIYYAEDVAGAPTNLVTVITGRATAVTQGTFAGCIFQSTATANEHVGFCGCDQKEGYYPWYTDYTAGSPVYN